MNEASEKISGWRFSRCERLWLWVSAVVILLFGANLEKRTALRRVPMSDLCVPVCAAGAVLSGRNLYEMSEWHGWHYNYPPTLAILFLPLSHPVPEPPRALLPGEQRTDANTPWGYDIDSHRHWYGLRPDNARFFWLVGIWDLISIALIALSAHALACALEGRRLREPPPNDPHQRRRWWALRTLPLLICAGSLGTDLSRGQMDVLMLGALTAGLCLAAARKDFLAGIFLAFPACVKLFPGLVFLYPAWRLRWRMMSGVVAGLALCLALLPMAVFGPQRTVEYYRTWLQVIAKPGLGQGKDTSRASELTALNGTDNQSFLAFVHNWRFHTQRRDTRPPDAAPGDRKLVYVAGAALILGTFAAARVRRSDSPRQLLIVNGILMGLALVITPVAHNYYYLFLLPLVAALLDYGGGNGAGDGVKWKLTAVLVVFAVTDFFARLPGIGPWLRDAGVPFLSMVALLVAGVLVLLAESNKTPQPENSQAL